MTGGQAGMWAMLAAFVVVLVLALTARTGKEAWGRGNLLCGLLSFAVPLAGLVFSGDVGGNIAELATSIQAYELLQPIGITPESVLVFAQAISDAETGVETAGAEIGVAGLGGMMVIGTLIFIGLFLGLIFIIIAFFLLRGGTLNQQRLPEGPVKPVVPRRVADVDQARQHLASPAQDPNERPDAQLGRLPWLKEGKQRARGAAADAPGKEPFFSSEKAGFMVTASQPHLPT